MAGSHPGSGTATAVAEANEGGRAASSQDRVCGFRMAGLVTRGAARWGFSATCSADARNALPLNPSRAAAARIEAQRAILEEMAGPVRDELELGPGEEMVLVFVGQPPDRLRVAWLADGDEQNVEGLFFEKGMTDRDLQRISDFLRVAYERHQREPRFTAVLAAGS